MRATSLWFVPGFGEGTISLNSKMDIFSKSVQHHRKENLLGKGNIMRNDTLTGRGPELLTRAARFAVQVPVRYRIPPSPEWFEARTENVSRTGVLFRTECVFRPTTRVDVRLELPPTNGDGSHAEIVCKGEVVRVEQTRGEGIPPALAIAIRNYRLRRKSQPN